MRRWVAALAGVTLVGIAFVASGRVADTREGLIAEVVTLLAGLAGVLLLLYGLLPQRRASASRSEAAALAGSPGKPRSVNDVVAGAAGLLLAALLLTGLVLSGGWQWAIVGSLLLLPMVAGCVYLCAAFAAAPERDWTLDWRRLIRLR